METPSTNPISAIPAGLRAARERAAGCVAAAKGRQSELETRFVERLDQIAQQLATELDAEAHEHEAVQQLALEQARGEFRDQQLALQREYAALEAEMVDRDQRVAKLEDELARALAEAKAHAAAQLHEQSTVHDLSRQLAASESAYEQLTQEVAQLRDQLAGLANTPAQLASVTVERDTLAAQFAASSSTHSQLACEAQQLREQLAELTKQHAAVVAQQAADQAALTARLSASSNSEGELASEVQHLRGQLEQSAAQHAAAVAKLTGEHAEQTKQLEQQLATALAKTADDHAAVLAAKDTTVADLEAALIVATSDAQQHAARETELAEQVSTLTTSLDERTTQVAALQDTIHELTQQLEQLVERVEQTAAVANDSGRLAAELATAQAQVAQLETALTAAQAAENHILTDLETLIGERDELRALLEAAQTQLAAPALQHDDSERVADLERRLELTLDDLRESTCRVSELEAQLAAGGSRAPQPAASNDGLDWESQKRRLLASLEEEGAGDAAREPERIKIRDVIAQTDAAMAALRRDLNDARVSLSDSNIAHASYSAAHDDQVAAAVDADEAVRRERAKLAELQTELSEKLRAAELELSVERAKIAREQSELAQWRMELESLREALPAAESSGKPRRRWLDQLGLGKNEP